MVLSGFTGLASIGRAACLGVGAGVQAVLSAKGWPFPPTMKLKRSLVNQKSAALIEQMDAGGGAV